MVGSARRQWLVGIAWGAAVLVASLWLARPDTAPTGRYALGWYAVGFMLLAVAGRTHRWASISATLLGGAAGIFCAVRWADALLLGQDRFAWPYVAGGIAVAALSAVQLTRRRLDSVVLAAFQLAIGLVAYWAYNAISGAGLDPNNYRPETVTTPFRAELPLLALALASIGLGLARPLPVAVERLGLSRPDWWQPFLAFLIAASVVGLIGFAGNLTHRLMPDAYYAIGAVQSRTAGNPLIALTYAVLAGICEETLFRGALQPRVGLVPAAILFAMIHVQYGVTPILLAIFVSGLFFGALRELFNTTTAVMAHVLVDLLVIVGLPVLAFQLLVPALVAVLVLPIVRWWRQQNEDAPQTTGANVLRPPGEASR